MNLLYSLFCNKSIRLLLGQIFTFSALILGINIISCSTNWGPGVVGAEEGTAGASPLDMGALASLASNLVANPQILSMVGSLLNPSVTKSNSPAGLGQLADLTAQTPPIDQDVAPLTASNASPIITTPNLGFNAEPLRRSMRQPSSGDGASLPKKSGVTSGQVAPATSPPGSSSLGSLMSLLPSILPGVNLNSLIGGLANSGSGGRAPTSSALLPTSATNGMGQTTNGSLQSTKASGTTSTIQPSATPATAPQTAPLPPIASGPSASLAFQNTTGTSMGIGINQGTNSAQAVINQVLTAYASGQIPGELIQLGLSGRVPPSIIELALSGQVPATLIQMVITGQVPMATINAFLNSIQMSEQTRTTSDLVKAPGSKSPETSANPPAPGLVSNTKLLFENLFNRSKDSRATTISVPTLVGSLPIQLPAFPSARRLGQMVGGSITNMASMIPFR